MAQTANPVTLYGRIHVTFESVESTGAGPLPRRNRVSDQASMFGIRGIEDLGGGLKAFFQLETRFKPDQNDSVFADRNSGVGLQGNWGSLLLGRWDTPYKTTTTAIDPFGDVTLGGYTAAMNGSGVRGVQGQFDRREANEGRTATLNPRSNGASLTWTGGPVYVGYAYHEFKDIVFGAAPSTVFTTLPKQTANQGFGTFAFGPIKLGAAYEEIKREGFGTVAVPGFSKHKAWLGNIVWTIGNNQLIYQYSQAKNGELQTVGMIEPDCNVNAVGWQYNFTRRTFFLAQYTKVENKNLSSTCNFGSTPGPITTNIAGQDPKGISLGLRHIF